MTEIKTYDDAVLYVQQNAPIIGKDSSNPFFKCKYADLPTIWRVIAPFMKTAELTIKHTTFYADGCDFIKTTISHSPSKMADESITRIILSKNTAQEYGSFITYMRRYHIAMMLGLQVDEDDDGNKASQAPKRQALKQEPPKKKPVFADTKARTDWMVKAKEAIEGIQTSEAVTIWINDNIKFISALGDKQQTAINGIAIARKEEILKDA